ncbi:class E sortase [Hamadaea flava]|uniref:class E sortase n=1 Tax=Hamadaea flava TaxID=1742688 RepID=UPI0020A3EE73|nr:class E sortase [Hamadaea flava]
MPVSAARVSGQPASGQPVSGQPVADDATTTIPRIPAADATTVIPRVDETSLIGKIPDVVPADADDSGKPARDRDDSGAPIRAVRRKDVYASAYADYTRVTVGSVIRTTLRTTGELLITCGLVLLLFAAYEVWGKAAIVDSHQNDLNQQLAQAWDTPTSSPSSSPATNTLAAPPGDAIARLYIPRLDKHWVVVQGVSPADIRYAPGHYPKSAMPGQDGNFSMAGHRMRSVFWDLDKLQVGDKIVVETRTTWYVYAVVKTRVVKPTQVEVVSPNPPEVKAAAKATNDKVTPGNPTVSLDRFLTLTTCNPKWDNYQRLIIHAALVDGSERPRADGPPAELKG